MKLSKGTFRLNMIRGKKSLMVRSIMPSNHLPREVKGAQSLETFKTKLGKVHNNVPLGAILRWQRDGLDHLIGLFHLGAL